MTSTNVAIEPLQFAAFGRVLKSIKGKNVGGVRNNIVIYEKGAEITGVKKFKGLRACINWWCDCCPVIEGTDAPTHPRAHAPTRPPTNPPPSLPAAACLQIARW